MLNRLCAGIRIGEDREMIKREDVMNILIDTCPSFKEKWEEYLGDIWDRDSETILFTDVF